MTRIAIAIARAGRDGRASAGNIAAESWGEFSHATQILKSAVAAGSLIEGDTWDASALSMYRQAQQEFFGLIRAQSIVGKLAGLRSVPLNVRILSGTTGAVAFWVGHGKPKPLTKMSLAGTTLEPRKIVGMVVVTAELIRSADPAAEPLLRTELVAASSELLDSSFIDPSSAGVAGESPASVTNGVTAIPSSGNPGTDVANLIENFPGNLDTAVWISDPHTAASLALCRDAGGSFMFPDAGIRGGSILGAPLVVSRGSPRATAGGILVLLDPSGIAWGNDGIRFTESSQGSIEMSDEPTNDATDPTATTLVSLWQSDAIALKVELPVNWYVARPSVAYVDSIAYTTGATP